MCNRQRNQFIFHRQWVSIEPIKPSVTLNISLLPYSITTSVAQFYLFFLHNFPSHFDERIDLFEFFWILFFFSFLFFSFLIPCIFGWQPIVCVCITIHMDTIYTIVFRTTDFRNSVWFMWCAVTFTFTKDFHCLWHLCARYWCIIVVIKRKRRHLDEILLRFSLFVSVRLNIFGNVLDAIFEKLIIFFRD